MQEKADLLDQDISRSHDLYDPHTRLKHREQYVTLIDRLKTIIAPHKRLPHELLADIFHLALPDDFRVRVPCRFFSPAHKREHALPWSFGHICSSWRQVALTDHRLWNRIRIQVEDLDPLHIQILETVLLRSGSAHLDIEMMANFSFIPVLDIVLPQAGRIYRLNLHTHLGGLCSFLSEFSTPGRTLSSLTEAILSGSHLEIPEGGIHIFGDRPLLRKLDIRLEGQSELLEALCGLHIPFSQLTELTLGVNSSPHSVLCILKEMVNLVRCSITFRDLSRVDDPAFDLVLPHLESLILSSYTFEILIRILQHITLPSLLYFWVDCRGPARQRNRQIPGALPSEVLALVDRSSCHLTHIALEGNLGPVVERLHRSLVSISAGLPASTVQRITYRELTLPHLEELNCALEVDTVTDLKNMVEALWPNGQVGGNVRRKFHSKCKIVCGRSVGKEELCRWEQEMKASLNRLSIEGWVELSCDEVPIT